jgi:hypothetical protein
MNLFPTLNGHVLIDSLLSIDVLAVEIIEHILHYVWMNDKQADNNCRNSFSSLESRHLLYNFLEAPKQVTDHHYDERHESENQKLHKECIEIVLRAWNKRLLGIKEAFDRDYLCACLRDRRSLLEELLKLSRPFEVERGD